MESGGLVHIHSYIVSKEATELEPGIAISNSPTLGPLLIVVGQFLETDSEMEICMQEACWDVLERGGQDWAGREAELCLG